MAETPKDRPVPEGVAEGEDVGKIPDAPVELREEDVMREDALDDRVAEEELPGDGDDE